MEAAAAPDDHHIDFSLLEPGELLAAACGVVLALSVFLGWYSTDSSNPHSNVEGHHGSVSAWQAHPILRILLLMAAAAPLILLWIIARQHQLSWPRGEVTAVVGITALVLVFYEGVVDRPGIPPDTIGLKYGWLLALLATIGMLAGAAWRSGEVQKARKAPGTI